MADLSWASLRVPRFVLTTRLSIPRCVAARAALPAPRPPVTTLFLKAFAIASAAQPVLRRAHATLPTPRLVEAEHPIGCIVLERPDDGMVSIARIHGPNRRTLPEMADLLDRARLATPKNDRRLRNMLRFARLPWPLRRLVLRLGLAFGSPILRAGGSFAVSSLGTRGVAIVDSVSILPCLLTYGAIDQTGAVDVYLAFDHRVMDGADGAMALDGLQAALEGPVAAELLALAGGVPQPEPSC